MKKKRGSITSIKTIYVPSDELTDPSVTTITSHIDASVILSRSIAAQHIFPAIDPSRSASKIARSDVIGKDHYSAITQFKDMLIEYNRLAHIVTIVGERELSGQDQMLYQRTKKVINYLTQSFFTTEGQTGRPGTFVPREQTIKDVNQILNGKIDMLPAEKLLYIGSLDELGLSSPAKR